MIRWSFIIFSRVTPPSSCTLPFVWGYISVKCQRVHFIGLRATYNIGCLQVLTLTHVRNRKSSLQAMTAAMMQYRVVSRCSRYFQILRSYAFCILVSWYFFCGKVKVGFCHASSRRFMDDPSFSALNQDNPSRQVLFCGYLAWKYIPMCAAHWIECLRISYGWKFILLFKARQFSDISVDMLPNKWFAASWNCQIESQDSGKNWCRVYMNI